jgi:hypothetical protein
MSGLILRGKKVPYMPQVIGSNFSSKINVVPSNLINLSVSKNISENSFFWLALNPENR